MSDTKTFISILLLSFFGLSLAADVFASDFRFCSESAEHQLLVTDNFSNQVLRSENQSTSHESEKSNCADPCHYGRCHFGHCTAVFSDNDVHLQPFELIVKGQTFNQSMIEAPFIEGPRRPPRLA